MEVCHDDEADADGDDAEKFDAIKTADAICKPVGDLAIENDDGCACSYDDGS